MENDDDIKSYQYTEEDKKNPAYDEKLNAFVYADELETWERPNVEPPKKFPKSNNESNENSSNFLLYVLLGIGFLLCLVNPFLFILIIIVLFFYFLSGGGKK